MEARVSVNRMRGARRRAGVGAPAAPIVRVVVAVRDEGELANAKIRRVDFGLLGGGVRRELDPVLHDGALGGRTVFDGTEPLQSGPKSSLIYFCWHMSETEQPVVLRWARRKPFDLKNPARDAHHRTNAQGAVLGRDGCVHVPCASGLWGRGSGAGGGERAGRAEGGGAPHVVPTALA